MLIAAVVFLVQSMHANCIALAQLLRFCISLSLSLPHTLQVDEAS